MDITPSWWFTSYLSGKNGGEVFGIPAALPTLLNLSSQRALLSLLLQPAPEEPHSLVQGNDSPSTPPSYPSPGKPAPRLILLSEILSLLLTPPPSLQPLSKFYLIIIKENKPQKIQKILVLVLASALTCWTFLSAFPVWGLFKEALLRSSVTSLRSASSTWSLLANGIVMEEEATFQSVVGFLLLTRVWHPRCPW